MKFDRQSAILVTCGPTLPGYLRSEVEALGYRVVSDNPGGLEIRGDMFDAMRLNLHLRTAYNVLYLVRQFKCNSPEQLYKQTRLIGWEDIIPADQYFSIVNRVDTPSIKNTMFASLKAKDAIVDRIMAKCGSRPDSGSDRHRIVLQMFWKNDQCWFYINTSGQKLSDRGYRKMPHRAPMRESLAAAVLRAAEYDGTVPFMNPMCGSGTLAIEVALTATRRPAGLLRTSFGFQYLKDFDAEAWKTLRIETQKEAKKLAKNFEPPRIIATDNDPKALEAARSNAQTAGVDHLIEFGECDFADTPLTAQPGLIMMNPEYGKRLGEIAELEKTYKRIGDYFKSHCAGHTGYIFTGNMDLAKKVGLRTSRKIPFMNGDIECRLLKYELYRGTRKNKDV